MQQMNERAVTVIGGGVSGCAAALAAAARGVDVTLIEQRPQRQTPLHETQVPAELVGTADLGGEQPDRAIGLLKAELGHLCPIPLECAHQARTGEQSLIVDRRRFAELLAGRIEADGHVAISREEARALPDGPVVVATGPATWSPLARALHQAAGMSFRFAFMGRPPLVSADGIDLSAAIREPLYPGAEPALFLPISDAAVEELARRIADGTRDEPPELSKDVALANEMEPIERVAHAPGELADGVLRGPLGPETQVSSPALCLVADDAEESAFHVEGFVTALTRDAQREALQAVGAMAQVEIVRPAMVHRLPWLPGAVLATMQLRRTRRVLLAGTLTGAAGYIEALATGAIAGLNAARLARGDAPALPPLECLTGALCHALAAAPAEDARMLQANFGMLPLRQEDEGKPKSERRERQVAEAMRAVESFAAW